MFESMMNQIGDFFMAHKGIAMIVNFLVKHADFIFGIIINLILISVFCKIADAFNLKNSPMLIQLITKDDNIYVLEFSARTGGGIKYLHIKNISGFDVTKAVVDLTLGEKPHYEKTKGYKFIVNDFIYCYPGIFDHLEGFEELKTKGIIHDYYQFKGTGAEFNSVSSSGDRIAGYTICADSYEELIEKHEHVNPSVKVIDINGNDMMRHDLITKVLRAE